MAVELYLNATRAYFFPSKSLPFFEKTVAKLLSNLNFVTWSRTLHSYCSGDASNQEVFRKLLVELLIASDVIAKAGGNVTDGKSDQEDCGDLKASAPSLFGPGLKSVPGGDAYR